MKTAILQVADQGPLESLVQMLSAVGYRCFIPSTTLKNQLRNLGCDTVLDINGLVRGMGYDEPMPLPEAEPEDMQTCDLYVDVKAHRNGPKIWKAWPRLEQRTLFYRINGGEPEITAKGGDEINLPCPILTPNLWYRESGPWSAKAYACWPPFYRFDDYFTKYRRHESNTVYTAPVCLLHSFVGWGYGALEAPMRELGIRIYGSSSPDGLISHAQVPELLSKALAMVHLKSSDAPGYALYEGCASACPMVVTRRLIWRNRMEELFEPGVTCLVFDQPTHAGLSDADVVECTREVREALERLADPEENKQIGMAAYYRLKRLMWDPKEDAQGLADFMARVFPA